MGYQSYLEMKWSTFCFVYEHKLMCGCVLINEIATTQATVLYSIHK